MSTKTVEIKGFIIYSGVLASLQLTPYRFVGWDPREDGTSDDVFVMEHTLQVEVPADFDPRPQQIKALEAQKKEAAAKFAAMVAELDKRIAELQAIEFSGSDA